MLMAYIVEPSCFPRLHRVCNALEVLCEYPEFAAQVFHRGGVAVLARVLVQAFEEPHVHLAGLHRTSVCAAICRTLCWVLVSLQRWNCVDWTWPVPSSHETINTGHGGSHSVAACPLMAALVRTLTVTRHGEVIASLWHRESVCLIPQCIAGADNESKLQDMSKSTGSQVVCSLGGEVADTLLSPSPVIIKLWNLQPLDIAVCKAACEELCRCACCSGADADAFATAHVHANGLRWLHSESCE